MNTTMDVISAVGGGIAATLCVIAAIFAFHGKEQGWGIGLLILSPIAYFAGAFLAIAAIVIAVLGFALWVWTLS